jgi:hypothetical protein
MLKMPKTHYIDVKSDEQCQQDITVLKSLEVSGTSLACLIMIRSLLDVTHKEDNWLVCFLRWEDCRFTMA